jgi:hypothetical protein
MLLSSSVVKDGPKLTKYGDLVPAYIQRIEKVAIIMMMIATFFDYGVRT